MRTEIVEIVLPAELLLRIDAEVGRVDRDAFIEHSARLALQRKRLDAIGEDLSPAWLDPNHPELENGSAEWIKALRQESDKRIERPGHSSS